MPVPLGPLCKKAYLFGIPIIWKLSSFHPFTRKQPLLLCPYACHLRLFLLRLSRRLETRIAYHRHFLDRRLCAFSSVRRPQRAPYSLRRFRQPRNPRSRPSYLRHLCGPGRNRLRLRAYDFRRHARRATRSSFLLRLFFLQARNHGRRLLYLLALRKLSLHRYLYGRRPHACAPARRLRRSRLGDSLHALERVDARRTNRPHDALPRLARHARHHCLARLPHTAFPYIRSIVEHDISCLLGLCSPRLRARACALSLGALCANLFLIPCAVFIAE